MRDFLRHPKPHHTQALARSLERSLRVEYQRTRWRHFRKKSLNLLRLVLLKEFLTDQQLRQRPGLERLHVKKLVREQHEPSADPAFRTDRVAHLGYMMCELSMLIVTEGI